MGGNRPETQAAYFKKWRVENREKYLEGKRLHYQRNREWELHAGWVRRLWRDFGISEEQYDEMHKRQGGICLICRRPETTRRQGTLRRLSVDHDHRTGRVRGLLCQRCNAGIGYLGDNPKRLRRALAYLEAEYLKGTHD